MSRDGKNLGEAGKEDLFSSFRISPDGKRFAVDRRDDSRNDDVWMLEFDRAVMSRLTFDPKRDRVPVWSPDGRQIVFVSNRSGVFQLYRKDAGGAGQEEQLTSGPDTKVATDWSRDGRYLLYTEVSLKTGSDLWALPLDGDRKPVLLLQTPFNERYAQFSPDGKRIAYQSDESGRYEVYVRAFPVSAGQWQVSSQGGTLPKWRADGKELYYVGPNLTNIIAAGIRVAGASVQTDTPRELFSVPALPRGVDFPYDVTADGQRFLLLQSAPAQGSAPPDRDTQLAGRPEEVGGQRNPIQWHWSRLGWKRVILFDWDPYKERANRRKHRVTFAEACTVFEDALARIFYDGEHSGHEIRELIVGHSAAGRLLIVSFTELLPDEVRIISAREATRTEQRDYEEAV